MYFKFNLINSVEDFMKDATLTEISIGCSDSQVIKIEKKIGVYFLKMAKRGPLTKEYKALTWLDGKLNVPKVMLFDDTTDIEYLITEAIPGEMLCSDNLLKDKDRVIEIIADAFHQLYKVDITNCPFHVTQKDRLKGIEQNVKNHLITYENLDEDVKKQFSSLEEILNYLKENQFEEELCFSHGDISLQNIFSYNNHFSGFIDIGECGIADKWFDLAICEKSIIRNLGEEYVDKFYQALHMVPEKKKTAYYLLLMELCL